MNLPHLITDVELDTGKYIHHAVAYARTGEEKVRFISASLLHEGEIYAIPENAELSVNIKRPDGKWCYNRAERDTERNRIIFELTPQAVSVPGSLVCELEIRDENHTQILTSCPFTVEVQGRVADGCNVAPSNELTAFDERWKRLDESNAIWEKAEQLRKENEILRHLAEEQRNLEERKRQEAESNRQTAEEQRAAAEAARVAAEDMRPKINDEIISKKHLWSSSKLHDAITPEVRSYRKRTAFTPAEGYPITAVTSIEPKLSGEEIPSRKNSIPNEGEHSPSPQIPRHIEPRTEITLSHKGSGQDELTTTTVQLPAPCYIGFYDWNTGEYTSFGVKFTSAEMTIKETKILPDYKHGCIIFNAPETMGGPCLIGWCSVAKLVCCPWFPKKAPIIHPYQEEKLPDLPNETPDCPHVVFGKETVELWLPLKIIGTEDNAIRKWVQETNKACPVEFCTFGKVAHREKLNVLADLTPKTGMNVISCDAGKTCVGGKSDFLATMGYYGASFNDLAYLMMVRKGEEETLSKYDPNSPNYVPPADDL